jgi:hypothetical protein
MSSGLVFPELEGVEVDDDGQRLNLSCPRKLLRAPRATSGSDLELEVGDESWRLTTWGEDADVRFRRVEALVAELHGRPATPVLRSIEAPSPRPEVACVVLLNQNDLYLRRRLLPALLASLAGHSAEVVVVCNGSRDPERLGRELAPVPVVASTWARAALGYDRGVAATTAPFLAFFHDDCVPSRPGWFEAARGHLAGGAAAVSGSRQPFAGLSRARLAPPVWIAKGVPLVLARRTLEEIGGWDDRHYLGWEDLDLTLALLERGEVLVRDLGVTHDGGMSTVLKYGDDSDRVRETFALGLLPRRVVAAMQRRVIHRLYADPTIAWLSFSQLDRLLSKRSAALARLGTGGVAELRAEIATELAKFARGPLDDAAVERHDRALAVARTL